MKKFLLFIFVLGWIQSSAQSKPNIIYIYADDLGYGELGCYGQTKIKTPNLDKLAAEGMRFTQHYSGAPVCAPARCMLMTGVHAGHSYIRGNYELGGYDDDKEGGQMPLAQGIPTIASMLKQVGYKTGIIGKWGMGVTNTGGEPTSHGFDYFLGYLDQKQAHNFYPTHLWENTTEFKLNNPSFSAHQKLDSLPAEENFHRRFHGKEYAPDVMTAKAKSFIMSNKANPFFLYLPYTLPHLALQVPDEELAQYKGNFEEQPYLGQNGYLPHRYPFSAYAGMISRLDKYVGELMALLKELNLDKNTLVMFSSDNGATFTGGVKREFFNSSGGLRGGKMELYDGGIRVPFLARWPDKIKASSTSDLVTAQFDLLATLAELTKTKPLANTDGISFLPTLLNKPQQNQHAYLYFEYPENKGQVAVRMGDWKAIKVDMKAGKNEWQLFNLKLDPSETENVAAIHPQLLKQFDAIVLKEHRHPHLKEWEFIDPKFNPEK